MIQEKSSKKLSLYKLHIVSFCLIEILSQFRDLKFWIFHTPVSHELLRLAIMDFLPSFYKFVLGLLFLVKLIFSKKYGIVEITSQNYLDMVINGEKDAWIVAVKGAGKISRAEWEDLEVNLRGLFVRVGILDPEKDGAFMKKKVNSLFKFLLQILLVEVFFIAASFIALQHLGI